MTAVRVHAVPEPHSADPNVLDAQRQIYARGKTPVRGPDGAVHPIGIEPAGAETAGRHLDEIADRYGDAGLSRSIGGLAVTRGWSFARMAVHSASSSVQGNRNAQAVAASIDPSATSGEEPVFSSVAPTQSTGMPVPSHVVARLPEDARRGIDNVRIHTDPDAHAAARSLGARAVTIGRDVYMGEGQYQPSTAEGQSLLTHEIAHTIQNSGVASGRVQDMQVSDPNSREETEADSFAHSVTSHTGDIATPRASKESATRLMRAITFTRANDTVTKADPGVRENAVAGTFQIANGAPTAPHFNWTADVTIHGNAGDPFGNFQVGPLQILRSWWFNVWWGTDANRTHRRGTVATPIRDALTAGNTWYADVLASGAFGAAGDVRSTGLRDSPGVPSTPFANPVAGRVGTRGWFNYGVSFVSFISARDTTAAGAGAFQHLAHVYWNLSINGNFDTTRAAGSQVAVQDAATNTSAVFAGTSTDDPPIIGGAVPNTAAVITTT